MLHRSPINNVLRCNYSVGTWQVRSDMCFRVLGTLETRGWETDQETDGKQITSGDTKWQESHHLDADAHDDRIGFE